MITLTLLVTNSEHQQWQFEGNSSIKVGRAPDNDVLLANEQVSRYHLELIPGHPGVSQHEWKAQGLGTNGTLLNGKFITQAVISHGDLIQLGLSGPVLKFEQVTVTQNSISASTEGLAPRSQPLNEGQQSSAACGHENNQPGNRFCIYCGEPLQVLEQWGAYQVVQILESKDREAAFLVRDIRGGRDLYILRQFQPESFSQGQARFEQTVQWLNTLNHPNIARAVDCFCEEPYRYVVMEKVSGLNLEEWVQQKKPSLPVAINTLLSICNSLKPLHSQSPPIIHHNLAPKNIVIHDQGQSVTLINFGSLRAAGLGLSTSVPFTVQSDLYRVGTALMYMLTGTNPSRYFKVQCLSEHIEWTSLPQIPTTLHLMIERMTHPDPTRRYHSVEELIEGLRNYRQELS